MSLRIKEIIKAKGLDVKTVAERMGISRVTLSTHINGNPSAQILERIAEAVGCKVGDFFTDGATITPQSTRKLLDQHEVRCGNLPQSVCQNQNNIITTNEETAKLLAEADTLKSRLSALRPLPVEALKKIEGALEIEFAYESNRIEGNTLTLQETEIVVNEGVTIAGKSMREHLEAINHVQAVGYIKDIATQQIEITERTIKEIHAIVLHGIDRENAGRYRNVPVMISGSTHTPPQPYLIEKQMEDFLLKFAEMETAKEHPVLIAAYLHDELVKIHPFIDGNGRTSRLLMNLYLLRHGYTLATLKGNNEDKISYYKALEKSHVEGDNTAFQSVVIRAEIASLSKLLGILGA